MKSMNREAMECLLLEGESEHLEWKEDFPDGLIQQKVIQGKRNPNWDPAKAELLKELIALANSAGRAPIYLVYSAKDLGRMRKVKGISKSFDDAGFQQWAKDTFDPPPTYRYTEIPWPPSKTIDIIKKSYYRT
jgi:hypothetical protein